MYKMLIAIFSGQTIYEALVFHHSLCMHKYISKNGHYVMAINYIYNFDNVY